MTAHYEDFATYRRPTARIWLRLLAINLLGFLAIFSSLYYLSQFQERRADQDVGTLSTEARLLAAALSDNMVAVGQGLDQIRAVQTLKSLTLTTQAAANLYDKNGLLIVTTDNQMRDFCASKAAATVMDYIINVVLGVLSRTSRQEQLLVYPRSSLKHTVNSPDAQEALGGRTANTLWQDGCGGLVLTAAAPIISGQSVEGVVLLTQSGAHITNAVRTARTDILIIAGFSMGLALLLSLYLGWYIAWPLQRLAVVARRIRQHPAADVIIPYQNRLDEVGGLAIALNAMWQALRTRLTVIESFAADVAHELKNPLTSLRSAFETLPRVADKPEAHDKLINIIHHDLQRLDRLISDIAASSLLDSELARAAAPRQILNIHELLLRMVTHYQHVAVKAADIHINYTTNLTSPLYVKAEVSRLEQVFGNLLDNALSFSPAGGIVTVKLQADAAMITVSVDDAGPGLPENKLDKIFDRFYTERPDVQQFGTHSGLGLAIAKQIIESYGGSITAVNRYDGENITGARLIISLPRAADIKPRSDEVKTPRAAVI